MVLNFDVHLHLLGPFLKMLDGVDELLHLARGTLSDESSAHHAGHMHLAPVFHREDQTQRARRMSRNENRGHTLIAQGDGYALEGIHVTLRQSHWRGRIAACRRWARDVYEIPIGRGH